MRTKDILHETYNSLIINKARTILTMIGIIIGISSVIIMISIGNGAKKSIQSSIESIGSNLLIVMPGSQKSFGGPREQSGTAKSLTFSDALAIEDLDGVKNVSSVIQTRGQILSKGSDTNTQIIGTTTNYQEVRNINIEYGVFFNESQIKNSSKVAVLGPTTKDTLFGDEDVLGKTVRINNIVFSIIGVTEAKGGSGFSNSDDVVYIPYTTAGHYLTGNEYLSQINIGAKDESDMTSIQENIQSILMKRHKLTNQSNLDFSITNQSDIIKTASSVTETFTILLAAVASISLIVGGIGIMNMMLTNVTERTREIGLRKAVGAKKKDINTQFLIEAIFVTLLGGIIGILIGIIFSYLINKLGIIQTNITIESILLSFGVSFVIGIIFGYYPAKRASNLNPIDALRFE
jgi:putative ABC transport system permease protein